MTSGLTSQAEVENWLCPRKKSKCLAFFTPEKNRGTDDHTDLLP